jgi:hypothetical protein
MQKDAMSIPTREIGVLSVGIPRLHLHLRIRLGQGCYFLHGSIPTGLFGSGCWASLIAAMVTIGGITGRRFRPITE